MRARHLPATFLSPAQGAAARLIVHLQASGPGHLSATVEGDRIVVRYDRHRPHTPPVWEGFLVDCLPRHEHPDHGWQAFLTGEPGHLPAFPQDDPDRLGA